MRKTSVLPSSGVTRRGLKLALKDLRSPQLHDALAILFYEDRAQLLRLIDAGLTATGYVVPASSRKLLSEALAEFGSEAEPTQAQPVSVVALSAPVAPPPQGPSPAPALPPAGAAQLAAVTQDDFTGTGLFFDGPGGLGLYRTDTGGGLHSIERTARESLTRANPMSLIIRALQHLDALRSAALAVTTRGLDQATLDALAEMGLDDGGETGPATAAAPPSNPALDMLRRGIYGN